MEELSDTPRAGAALLLAFTACFFMLPRAALGFDEAMPVAKPDVKIGDRWVYRRTDVITGRTQFEYEMRVTFVGPEAILAVAGRRGGELTTDLHSTAEWNPLLSDGYVYTPHGGWFKFPLTVGESHDSAYTTQKPNEDAKSERKTVVVGWEDVVVPAGKFRALKVEIKGTWQLVFGRAGGTTVQTIWYVPEVKRWVKFDYKNAWNGGGSGLSSELLEYSLQK